MLNPTASDRLMSRLEGDTDRERGTERERERDRQRERERERARETETATETEGDTSCDQIINFINPKKLPPLQAQDY